MSMSSYQGTIMITNDSRHKMWMDSAMMHMASVNSDSLPKEGQRKVGRANRLLVWRPQPALASN